MAKEKKEKLPGYEELHSAVKSNTVGNVYIFFGEETYLMQQAIRELQEHLVPTGFEEFNYHRLAGKGLTVQEITEAAEAMPMMAEHTLVTVTDMDIFKLDEAQRGALVALLEDFPEYCTLVFLYRQIPYTRDGRLKKLTAAVAEHRITKEYLAVLRGTPEQDDATLTDLLFRDAAHNKSYVVKRMRKGVRQASLSYTVQGEADGLTLVRVQLHTGRTHQIRAHMASIGCPILGDSKYGNNSANRELKLKYQALCAWELTMPRFTQPDFAFLSGKTFHAPKPWYYQQVLDGTLK